MAFRPIVGMVLALLLTACSSRSSDNDSAAAAASAGHPSESEPHTDFSLMEGLAREALADCVADSSDDGKRYFVLIFQGLVGFASVNPQDVDDDGVLEQDDFRAVLVDARSPGDVRVLRNRDLNEHEPVLAFRTELLKVGEPSPGKRIDAWTEETIAGYDIGVKATSDEVVTMHQEVREESPCSLKWAILVDELVERPRHRLRADVFKEPPGRDVTSRFVVGEGTAFTASVFPGCRVNFPRTDLDRTVASLIAVAVPAAPDRTLTLEGTSANGSKEWTFQMRDGSRSEVVVIRNHAVKNNRKNYDFAAHLALREGMNGAGVVVPVPDFTGCSNPFRTDNPQCSPANNQWP